MRIINGYSMRINREPYGFIRWHGQHDRSFELQYNRRYITLRAVRFINIR